MIAKAACQDSPGGLKRQQESGQVQTGRQQQPQQEEEQQLEAEEHEDSEQTMGCTRCRYAPNGCTRCRGGGASPVVGSVDRQVAAALAKGATAAAASAAAAEKPCDTDDMEPSSLEFSAPRPKKG